MTTAVLGSRELPFGGEELRELVAANDRVDDGDALRALLEEHGYLFFRRLISRSKVLHARVAVFEELAERGWTRHDFRPVDGVAHPPERQAVLRHDPVSRTPALVRALEAPELFKLFQTIYGEQARTFPSKFLRAVGRSGATGVHLDNIFMGQGSPRLLTCWVPIGEVPIAMGPLAICLGSSKGEEFARLRATYGRMDAGRDAIEPIFTDEPLEVVEQFGGTWATADFEAGDVVVFDMMTLHASLRNQTDRFRLSADVRFQPAAEPIDPRLASDNSTAGKPPPPVFRPDELVAMAEARRRWNL